MTERKSDLLESPMVKNVMRLAKNGKGLNEFLDTLPGKDIFLPYTHSTQASFDNQVYSDGKTIDQFIRDDVDEGVYMVQHIQERTLGYITRNDWLERVFIGGRIFTARKAVQLYGRKVYVDAYWAKKRGNGRVVIDRFGFAHESKDGDRVVPIPERQTKGSTNFE